MKEILHFSADWCRPCDKLKPIIEQYILENSDVKYTVIDVDTKFDIAHEWAVRSVPTLILLVDGDMRARHTGVLSYGELDRFVNGQEQR